MYRTAPSPAIGFSTGKTSDFRPVRERVEGACISQGEGFDEEGLRKETRNNDCLGTVRCPAHGSLAITLARKTIEAIQPQQKPRKPAKGCDQITTHIIELIFSTPIYCLSPCTSAPSPLTVAAHIRGHKTDASLPCQIRYVPFAFLIARRAQHCFPAPVDLRRIVPT